MDVKRLIKWHMESAQKLRRGAADRADFLQLEQLASDYESTAHLLAVLMGRNGNGNGHSIGNGRADSYRSPMHCPKCGVPANTRPTKALVDAARAMEPGAIVATHKCHRCFQVFDFRAQDFANAS